MDRDNVRDDFDCSLVCSEAIISGPDRICSSGAFSVPSGANSYRWSVTGDVTLRNTNTRRVVLVEGDGGTAEVTLSVRINTECGQRTLTKIVELGRPRVRTTRVPPICAGQILPKDDEYILPPSPGAEQYRLVSNHPNLLIDLKNEITFSDNNNGRPILFTARAAGSYSATLYVTNSCGTSSSILFITARSFRDCENIDPFFTQKNNLDLEISKKLLYPNPAKQQVTIDLNHVSSSNESLSDTVNIYAIAIMNKSGKRVREIKLEKKQTIFEINIEDLKPDLYFVIFQTDQGSFSKTLLVE